MNHLKHQYRIVAIGLFSSLAVLLFVVFRYVVGWETVSTGNASQAPRWLVTLLTTVGVYGLLYKILLTLYERHVWAWFNRRLDCRGRWYFKATPVNATASGSHVGVAFIEQTVHTIRIFGDSQTSLLWQVRCTAFNDAMQGFIAYTGISRDRTTGLCDSFCGLGRFGPQYETSGPHERPTKLLFMCHEMRVGGTGYEVWDIHFARTPWPS